MEFSTKTVTVSIVVLSPLDQIVGTGPEDDAGLPTTTNADFEEAKAAADRGERYVFGRIQVFPEELESSYRSPLTTDLSAGAMRASLASPSAKAAWAAVPRLAAAPTSRPWSR